MARFSPGVVPTAFMLFGLGLTWSLGFWQLDRHLDKQALKAEILDGLSLPVLGAAELQGEIDALYYRKIEVRGRFVEPRVLTAGRKELGRVGYGVVEPFQIDGGPLVLVDRGWIPRDGLEQALTEIDTEGREVRLQGQLRPVEGGGKGLLGCGVAEPTAPLPPAEGRPETWPPGAWPALVARLPAPRIDGIVLAGEPILAGEGKRPEPLPVDGYKPLPRMRDSLSYAFQWWIFGTVLLGVWIALGVSRARRAAAPRRKDTPA